MAKGSYSHEDHARAASGRARQRREEIFTGQGLDEMMDIRRKGYRECLRVAPYEHALPIAVALDETGSMDHIPHFCVANAERGLPSMMRGIKRFLPHPQPCFMGIGDARNGERAPIQVGHFEGEGDKMDHWLTRIYLERAGGGNGGESYELGLYVGARCVRADAFRDGERGYHVTIGDDNIWDEVRAVDLRTHFGVQVPEDIPTQQIMAEMAPNWHAFFICPDPGRGTRHEANWRRFYGDNTIIAPTHEDIAIIITGLVGVTEGKLENLDDFDRLMAEEFGRDNHERARVIATLEAYAATRGAAGDRRSSSEQEPRGNPRASGNGRV